MKDPIRFAGGDTNLYGYVVGDPVNFLDLDGKSQYWANAWQNFKDTNASVAGKVTRTVTNFSAGMKVASTMDASVGGSIFSGLNRGSKIGVFVGRTVAVSTKSTLTWEVGAAAGSLINAMTVPGSDGTIREWWSDALYNNSIIFDSPGSWLYDFLHQGGDC